MKIPGITRNSRKTEYPGGDGCTDVGTHNNCNGLTKFHNARVNETDYHNGCGRRRLDNAGHYHSEQKALKGIAGHFFKNVFKLTARFFLKSVAHKLHSEKEEGKTADEFKSICKSHISIPLFVFSAFILTYRLLNSKVSLCKI